MISVIRKTTEQNSEMEAKGKDEIRYQNLMKFTKNTISNEKRTREQAINNQKISIGEIFIKDHKDEDE